MKTNLTAVAAATLLSSSALAHDIGHKHEHVEGGWNSEAGFVSDVDVKARLWNPRGKSQADVDERAEYVAQFFDGGRTAADRSGDVDIKERYKDAIVINSLMPSGIGTRRSRMSVSDPALRNSSNAASVLAIASALKSAGRR